MAEVKDYAEQELDINEIADRIRKESRGASAVQEAPAPETDDDNAIDVDIDNIEFEVESDGMVEEQYEEPYDEPYEDYTYGNQRGAVRAINKHAFTWLFNFVLGMYGGDRFIRGQVGLGILKMMTFGGLGFWYLADLMIAMQKSYAGPYSDSDDILFDRFGRYVD